MTETYWVRNEYLCQGDKGRRTRVTDVVLKADHAQLVRALKESRAETEAIRLHKEAQREANLNGAKRLAEVVGERDALVRLVKALPKVEGEIHIHKTPCGRDLWNDFVWCVESDLQDNETWDHGTFDTEPEAKAYAALLTYRKELGG